MEASPILEYITYTVFHYRRSSKFDRWKKKLICIISDTNYPLKSSVFVAQKRYTYECSIKTNSQTMSEKKLSREIGNQSSFDQISKRREISAKFTCSWGIKLKWNFQLNHFALAYLVKIKIVFLCLNWFYLDSKTAFWKSGKRIKRVCRFFLYFLSCSTQQFKNICIERRGHMPTCLGSKMFKTRYKFFFN